MKIIYLLSFSPKYEFYSSKNEMIQKADHYWLNMKNEVIGVYGVNWGYQIGKNMISNFSDIEFEVWRPDYRADKVYEHRLYSGVLHKSYPCEDRIIWKGLKKKKEPYCITMENDLLNLAKTEKDVVLMMPAQRMAISVFLSRKLRDRIPILNFHFINNSYFLNQVEFSWNMFKLLNRFIARLQTKNFIVKMTNISLGSTEDMDVITKMYKANFIYFNSGVDVMEFNVDETKNDIRKRLSISNKTKVILSSSRIIPEKRIHIFIEQLSDFRNEDFHLFITGYGPRGYTNIVQQTIEKYNLENKVSLVGYIERKELMCYYKMSDLLIMMSTLECGPQSTFLALWHQVPVLSTDTGIGYLFLKKHDVGYIIPKENVEKVNDVLFKFFNEDKQYSPNLQNEIYNLIGLGENFKSFYKFIKQIKC